MRFVNPVLALCPEAAYGRLGKDGYLIGLKLIYSTPYGDLEDVGAFLAAECAFEPKAEIGAAELESAWRAVSGNPGTRPEFIARVQLHHGIRFARAGHFKGVRLRKLPGA
jgi:hypothetical protein